MSSSVVWFLMSVIHAAASILFIWLVTKLRKPEDLEIKFASPRKEAATAIGYVVGTFLALAVALFLMVQSAGAPLGTTRQFDLQTALLQWGLYSAIFIIPIFLIIKTKKQSFETVGLTKKNLGLSLGTGLVIALTVVALSTTPERLSARVFSWNTLYALVYYLAVGFGEELMFRGFLQLRCSIWLGETRGWLLASTIMALIHIPQRTFAVGLDPLQALVSSLSLMPISLLLGFFVLRTRNILGPAALHTVADWVSVL